MNTQKFVKKFLSRKFLAMLSALIVSTAIVFRIDVDYVSLTGLLVNLGAVVAYILANVKDHETDAKVAICQKPSEDVIEDVKQ